MSRLRWTAFALAAAAAWVSGCGGNGATFNPTPAVTALFPSAITAGSAPFVVFIGGTNFQSTSTAQWNGIDRPSVFNDATEQMAIAILDTDVANPGTGQITVTNPTPGGGVSQTALSLLINPQAVNGPAITSISPTRAVIGSNTPVTLMVTGSNFAANDAVSWNGSPRVTTFNSPTSLTATITTDDIDAAGLDSIAVLTTTPGVASPSVQFAVGPSSNPAPTLTSLTPATTPIGTLPPGSFILLTGKNFVPGSVVNFNGSPRPTGYASATQLGVGLTASDVATGATLAVTVMNPNPGGGTSSPAVNFTVK